jgi:hypothetical protein
MCTNAELTVAQKCSTNSTVSCILSNTATACRLQRYFTAHALVKQNKYHFQHRSRSTTSNYFDTEYFDLVFFLQAGGKATLVKWFVVVQILHRFNARLPFWSASKARHQGHKGWQEKAILYHVCYYTRLHVRSIVEVHFSNMIKHNFSSGREVGASTRNFQGAMTPDCMACPLIFAASYEQSILRIFPAV